MRILYCDMIYRHVISCVIHSAVNSTALHMLRHFKINRGFFFGGGACLMSKIQLIDYLQLIDTTSDLMTFLVRSHLV